MDITTLDTPDFTKTLEADGWHIEPLDVVRTGPPIDFKMLSQFIRGTYNSNVANYNTRVYAGYLWVAYWPGSTNATLARIPIGTGGYTGQLRQTNWTEVNLNGISGNPISTMVNDSHNNLNIAFDSAGRIHLVGNQHNNALKYVVCSDYTQFDDITKWSVGTMIGTQETSVTYPMFPDPKYGELLFAYRDGAAGDGIWYVNVHSAGSNAWTRRCQLFSDGAHAYNAYPAFGHGRSGKIYIPWTWTDSGGGDANGGAFFGYTDDDFRTVKRRNGSLYTLPIAKGSEDVILSVPKGTLMSSINSVAEDADGHVHTVWTKSDSTNPAAILTLGAATGYGISCSASVGVFAAADVGKYIWTDDGGNARIRTFTNSTTLVLDIDHDFGGTTLASGGWGLSTGTNIYHAWDNGNGWSVEAVTNWSYNYNPLTAGSTDFRLAQPRIFITKSGRICVLYRHNIYHWGEWRLRDITDGLDDASDVAISRIAPWQMNTPFFDQKAVWQSDRLDLLCGTCLAQGVVSYEDWDNTAGAGWFSQIGYVLSLDLAQIDTIFKGGYRIPGWIETGPYKGTTAIVNCTTTTGNGDKISDTLLVTDRELDWGGIAPMWLRYKLIAKHNTSGTSTLQYVAGAYPGGAAISTVVIYTLPTSTPYITARSPFFPQAQPINPQQRSIWTAYAKPSANSCDVLLWDTWLGHPGMV